MRNVRRLDLMRFRWPIVIAAPVNLSGFERVEFRPRRNFRQLAFIDKEANGVNMSENMFLLVCSLCFLLFALPRR